MVFFTKFYSFIFFFQIRLANLVGVCQHGLRVWDKYLILTISEGCIFDDPLE